MADEKSEHSDTSNSTSPPQENDVGGSTHRDTSTSTSSPQENEEVGGSTHSDTSCTNTSSLQENEDVGGSTHSDTSTSSSSVQENEDVGCSTRSDTSTSTSSLQENEDVGGSTPSDTSTSSSSVQENEDVGGSTHSDTLTSTSSLQENEDAGGCTHSDTSTSSSSVQENEDVGGSTHSDTSTSTSSLQDDEDVGVSTDSDTSSSTSESVNDGPLTPEYGGSTEARSKSKGSHKNKKTVHPQAKTFFGRNPGLKTAGNYSRSESNDGGVLTPELGDSKEARSNSKCSQKNKKAVVPQVKIFYGRNPGSRTAGYCSQSENNVSSVFPPEAGGSTEASSISKGSHKDKMAVVPQVKIFYGRNPGSRTAGNCSRSENNVDGISSQGHKVCRTPSLTQNVGVHRDKSTSASPLQHNEDVEGSTHVLSDTRDIGEMGNKCDEVTSLVQSCSPEKVEGHLQTLEVGGSTEAKSKSKDSYKNKNVVLPRVKIFYGRNPGSRTAGSYSRSEKNVGGISSQCQEVEKISSLTQNVGVHSSMVQNATEYSGPAQNTHGSDLSKNDDLVPAAGQQYLAHQNNPVQTVEGGLFPLREGLQLADGKDGAAQVADGSTFLENTEVQPNDQLISGSRRNGHAQASNASVGPFLKRNATQPLPIIARAVRGRTSIHPYFLAPTKPVPPIAYPAQTASVPPPAQTGASLPSLPQSVDLLQSSSQPRALPFPVQSAATQPYLPRTVHQHQIISWSPPPLRIPLDFNETPPVIGVKCFLCQRDVQLAPEGEEPAAPQTTCVLACHHCYHTACLRSVTPADQSHDPPCIQCQVNILENDRNLHSSNSSSR